MEKDAVQRAIDVYTTATRIAGYEEDFEPYATIIVPVIEHCVQKGASLHKILSHLHQLLEIDDDEDDRDTVFQVLFSSLLHEKRYRDLLEALIYQMKKYEGKSGDFELLIYNYYNLIPKEESEVRSTLRNYFSKELIDKIRSLERDTSL